MELTENWHFGFENVFSIQGVDQQTKSIHLRCSMHVADDMKAELQNIGISERRTREIISEKL